MPNIPLTDKGWLIVNFAIQVTFIAYVVFFTAYKFAQIRTPENVEEKENIIWKNLQLYDPSSLHEKNPKENLEERMEDWKRFKLAANKVVKQFSWFWLLAWFSWLLHYGYLLAASLGWLTPSESVRNLLNNFNSLMFVFLFMTLTVSTSKYGPLFWSKLICLILAIYTIEWLTFRLSNGNEIVALSFTIVSGLFASTALAAFVGSINSKFINVPIWLIPALYLYAAIQSLYVFFEMEDITLNMPAFVDRTQILITVFAFILKTILFITVTWILRTGRLVYFIIQESSLNFKRDDNFSEFLDVIDIKEAELT